jgi:queuine tRNA-ribosyltransferase
MAKQYTWEIAACQEGAGFTLREKETGNLMHSRIGPWVEANRVYVDQSELGRRQSSGRVVIYDVGLGIAANALAAIETGAELEIVSFERYPEALNQALQAPPEAFPFLAAHLEKLSPLLRDGSWSSGDGRVRWRLVSGDFREIDISALPPADLVYFDFYAPAVCPELWTQEVFAKVRGAMKERDSLLITYAANKTIRSAMLLAGFFVGEGVGTSMKGSTTMATRDLSALHRPLDRTWLESLERSSKALPLAQLREHPQFS